MNISQRKNHKSMTGTELLNKAIQKFLNPKQPGVLVQGNEPYGMNQLKIVHPKKK